ncbi:MAG: hypothetical protein OXI01_12835 [Albidovulum sp.]|nr:hypothetical protein [Albidovulum sp.]
MALKATPVNAVVYEGEVLEGGYRRENLPGIWEPKKPWHSTGCLP